MMKGMVSLCLICFFLFPLVLSCTKQEAGPAGDKAINVVTTLFPLYDFARNVGGDLVEVELLLPPGMEPHSFEPKPADIRKINEADVFLFTGKFMEPWVDDVLNGISNNTLLVVDTSTGVVLAEDHAPTGDHHGDQKPDATQGRHRVRGAHDPHIWLDFSNAGIMVENVLNAFISKNPEKGQVFIGNAEAYLSQLAVLDKQFRDELSSCRRDTVIHAGHFAFGYLAKRYHLRYFSAYRGFSSNAEPVPGDLLGLIKNLRRHRLNYIFFEELVSPAVAETIARETGARMLMLHGAHNVSKDDWDRNVTFLSLMEKNLKNLSVGLECQ